MRFFVTLGILLLLGCIVCAADAGPTYPIVIDRGHTVGEKYHIAVTGTDEYSVKITDDGEVLKDKTKAFSMRLDATIQVLEVNERKDVVKESITIDKCVQIVDGQEVPLAEKGTVVIGAVVNNEDTFTINDKPLSEDLANAFGIAISLAKNEVTDEEVFGTREQQHVGDSWNIDTAKAAKMIALGAASTAETKDITGKSTLKEVTVVNGQQCLRLTTQMQVKNMKPAELPPEITIKNATYTVMISGLLPVDTTRGPIEEQAEMTVQFTAEGKDDPDSPAMTVKTSMKRTVTKKYSPAE